MSRSKAVSALAVLGLAVSLLAPAGGWAAVEPYGKDDAGGFRNVLPAGEAGVASLPEALEFLRDGTYPPHWVDQQPLYDDLLYAAPTLTDADIPSYFKDATFGSSRGTSSRGSLPNQG
jgi:hypothetical protein